MIKKIALIIIVLLNACMMQAQIISTVAGTGSGISSGDGGPATAAGLSNPGGGEFDKIGNYYFADAQSSHRIRKIDQAGIITTVAGNGSSGYNMDGIIATSAKLNLPQSIRVDASGNLYIADAGNNRIRKVDITGIISTIVGTGTGAFGGDGGAATAAQIWNPQDICFDKWGNLYIADVFNYRIRKVSPSGIISTFAGNGTPGYTGDAVLADTTRIGLILGLCSDTAGNIYISDNSNFRIRKINVAGIITTVAGNGVGTYIGDGMPATSAQIIPERVFVDWFNNIFISDKSQFRVYKVDNAGIFHSIAGDGIDGDGGDGSLATIASLSWPVGIAMDACGNIYIPTPGKTIGLGKRIRKVTYPPILTVPTITITTEPGAAPIGTTVTVTATVSNAGSSYLLRWYNRGVQFAITTTPSVTYVKQAGVDTITARVVSTASYGCYDSTMSAVHTVSVTAVSVPFGKLTMTGVSIWPNPVNNELHIDDVAVRSFYRIFSVVGTVIQQGTLKEGNNSVSMQSLPAGMYMVEVVIRQAHDDKGIRFVRRIVKE